MPTSFISFYIRICFSSPPRAKSNFGKIHNQNAVLMIQNLFSFSSRPSLYSWPMDLVEFHIFTWLYLSTISLLLVLANAISRAKFSINRLWISRTVSLTVFVCVLLYHRNQSFFTWQKLVYLLWIIDVYFC